MILQPLVKLTECQLAAGRSTTNIELFVLAVDKNRRDRSRHTVSTQNMLALNLNDRRIQVARKLSADGLVHQIVEVKQRLIFIFKFIFGESGDFATVCDTNQGAPL